MIGGVDHGDETLGGSGSNVKTEAISYAGCAVHSNYECAARLTAS